jgi:hypothetical protein
MSRIENWAPRSFYILLSTLVAPLATVVLKAFFCSAKYSLGEIENFYKRIEVSRCLNSENKARDLDISYI